MAKDGVVSLGSRGVGKVSSTTKSSFSTNAASKARVSDRLEEDAQAMEERLIQLRMKMMEDKQRFEKELPAKYGGSRWRSAQESIGSVSRYAKDVEEKTAKGQTKTAKTKSISEAGMGDKKSNSKKASASAESIPITSVSAIKKWNTKQVLEWLTSIGLDEYHPTFEFYQVTGPVLLDLRIEELAQIGVDRLSARNRLWSELERVKASSKATSAQIPGEIIDPKIRDVPAVPEVDSPDKKGIHWSQVKPLRDEDAPVKGQVPVNLADGEFDEDDSHASFMKALLDWRAGDDDVHGKSSQGGDDDDMWFNPTMINTKNETEAIEEGGGALLVGEYDEAKEQEAFRRAVMAWRSGAPSQGPQGSRPSTGSIEKTEQAISTDQKKSCWHCYRVVTADSLVVDSVTRKPFCSSTCADGFKQAFASLYEKENK